MARPKSVIPKVSFEIQLREDLATKVKLALYSDLEGRIPLGAISKLFEQLVADYLNESAELYLAQFFPEFSPGTKIRGDGPTIEALNARLSAIRKEAMT